MKGMMLCLLAIISQLCFANHPEQSAVVSSTSTATKAGIAVLEHGGNAFDAAISIASDLRLSAPLHPDRGVWLIHDATSSKDSVIEGSIADEIAFIAQKYGKLPASKTLASYGQSLKSKSQIIVSEPLVGEYHGMKLITAPLPALGGAAAILALDILKEFHLNDLSDADKKHLIAETIRRVNCDIINQDKAATDIKSIINKDHIHALRANIKMNRISAQTQDCRTGKTFKDSVGFSVIDREGNRVSAILTLNEATGISLGVPLFFETDNGIGIVNATGGYRTLAATLLSVLTAMEDTQPQAWIATPRFMQVSPNLIDFEKDAFNDHMQNALKLRGHTLKQVDNFGEVQGIFWQTKDNEVFAAADTRGKGVAQTVRINPTGKVAP